MLESTATSVKRCALPLTKPRKIAGSVRLSLSYSAATDTGKSPILRAAACTDGRSPMVTNVINSTMVDWSEEGLVVGSIYDRVQVSHMLLCASRAFWLVDYPSQGHEMLFDAHTRS